MKLLLCFLLIFSFCFYTETLAAPKFAQDRCPQLQVDSVTPYDWKLPITYEAILTGEKLKNLKFVWKVEKFGRIISGQRTSRIKVKTKARDRYQGLTATVEIYGLPLGCPNIASTSAAIT